MRVTREDDMTEEQVREIVKQALAEDRARIASALTAISVDYETDGNGNEFPNFDRFIMEISDAIRGE